MEYVAQGIRAPDAIRGLPGVSTRDGFRSRSQGSTPTMPTITFPFPSSGRKQKRMAGNFRFSRNAVSLFSPRESNTH
jgi:hypothetical protein